MYTTRSVQMKAEPASVVCIESITAHNLTVSCHGLYSMAGLHHQQRVVVSSEYPSFDVVTGNSCHLWPKKLKWRQSQNSRCDRVFNFGLISNSQDAGVFREVPGQGGRHIELVPRTADYAVTPVRRVGAANRGTAASRWVGQYYTAEVSKDL